MPQAVSPEKLTARFVVMFPEVPETESTWMKSEKLTAHFVVMFAQVPETESTWLISERLEAATSVVGLKLAPPQIIQIEPGQGPYSQPNITLTTTT
jgi:hypothetical protein